MATVNKPPLRRSDSKYPTLLITKYMGSKKAILEFVAEELTSLTKPGDIIVDIMAGTHTIGYAMKNRCKIVANDIQRFSRVIGETLLNYNPEHKFEGEIGDTFKRFFLVNFRHLANNFQSGVIKERQFLNNINSNWEDYREFCEGYPHFLRSEQTSFWPDEFALLFAQRRVNAYQTLNKLEPYSLFSLYYANTYVGVQQAAEIDSVRCAIDKICDGWLPEQKHLSDIDAYSLRCMLISALIGVVNKINPGPGHWAAYPHVSEKNFAAMVAARKISVWDTFLGRVLEYEKQLVKNLSDHGPHIIMTEDYANFMTEVKEYIRQAKVVYLDPPYSQGHYSRFYHLIETLTRYDYPDIAFSGRYRTDRHQSPFAQKEKIASAIGKVCELSLEGGAILVASYSRGGVLKDSDAFQAILERYYPAKNIKLKKLVSVHSKLGKAQRMDTEEYLFTCKP